MLLCVRRRGQVRHWHSLRHLHIWRRDICIRWNALNRRRGWRTYDMWRCNLHSHIIRMLIYVSVIIAKIFRHRYPLHMRGWNIWSQVSYIRGRYTCHLHLHRLRHKGRDGRDVVVILNWELLIKLCALSVLRLIVAMPCLWTRWRSSPGRRRTRRRTVFPI